MNKTATGWIWVVGQAVLLGAMILVPGRSDWSNAPWLTLLARVVFFGGLVGILISALGLGTALTPTPVPVDRGSLKTGGLFRFVRHPIYTAVLAVVVAMAVSARSWIHALVAVVTIVFFDRKAAWEERQLVERYPGYAAYAAVTPKFIPGLRR